MRRRQYSSDLMQPHFDNMLLSVERTINERATRRCPRVRTLVARPVLEIINRIKGVVSAGSIRRLWGSGNALF